MMRHSGARCACKSRVPKAASPQVGVDVARELLVGSRLAHRLHGQEHSRASANVQLTKSRLLLVPDQAELSSCSAARALLERRPTRRRLGTSRRTL